MNLILKNLNIMKIMKEEKVKKFMQNFDLQGDEKAAHRLLGKKISYLALYD